MSPLTSSRNLAARMGSWSASHRKTAIFGWLAFVIAAIAIGNAVGQRTIDQHSNNVGQAHRADQILAHAGFGQSGRLTEIVVVQSKTFSIANPAFRAAVSDVTRTVASFPAVRDLTSPLSPANRDQISSDGRTGLVEWNMTGTLKAAEQRIDPLTQAVAAVAGRHPGLYIGEASAVSSDKAINNLFKQQLSQAGERSIPLTLLILVLLLGSLMAAWVPLMVGLQSVVATVGLIDIFSHLMPMDPSAGAVVLLVGLAVGVDYTLFYLRREREERAAGRGQRAALEAAAATSGRSVLISGATVMIAMAGMLFSGDQTFTSISIATMIVVAVAMIGSLTVLPAVLSCLGDRVEKGRIPLLGRHRRTVGEGRVWSKILTPVLRRPAVSMTVAAAALIALAIPALQMHTAQCGTSALPRSAPTVETLDRVQAVFPGQASPAVIAVRTDTDAPAFKSAVLALRPPRLTAPEATGRSASTPTPPTPSRGSRSRCPEAASDGTSTKALLALRRPAATANHRRDPRRQLRRHRPDRRLPRLEPDDEELAADRVRLRAHVRVPAAAGVVPLVRDRRQGRRSEPAVGRGRLRRGRGRVPVRLGPGTARLPVQRRDRPMAADCSCS